MEVPPNLKIEPPYDPAILILVIYHKEMRSVSQNDILISTPTFIVLFTIMKVLNQPKCPLTDEWIKKI